MMSHYDSSVQQTISTYQDYLKWSAISRIWWLRVGNIVISVPEAVYSHMLTAFLASHGITRKTYLEIMTPAEQEWKRQCKLEDELRSNISLWLFQDIPGVIIHIDK